MSYPKGLKDINFLEIQNDLKTHLFKGTASTKEKIMKILMLDSLFLQSHNIMDYSMLLVIEDKTSNKETIRFSVNSSILENGDSRNRIGKQHIGIIDYLQLFNFNKKVEGCWKTKVLGKKSNLLSSAPPSIYQKRFMKFMKDNVFSDEKEDYNHML